MMDIAQIKLKIPNHLSRYIVEQDYSRYTPLDQAAWRYIMRRLTQYLSKKAHSVYMKGMEKSGIEIDKIPDIETINKSLQKFGWRAVPVSGFIPPAAFMELQSLGILPIASDMRTVEHILYTPAPDIVHEAAGHAPILIDKKFAGYLKKYAQVARKAIISSEDLDLYKAIRILSDVKENPDSTPHQIKDAEQTLERVYKNMSHISEAGLLSRMNWWTAEYGLIGTLKQPKIFGAGLLSSVGESESCFSEDVKKIPLSVDCINYSYNITEPQPQLFVTPTFKHLEKVLNELARQMAFKTGGLPGLQKAKKANSVNTVEYSSGLQVSRVINKILKNAAGTEPIYINFKGPCQLSFNHQEIEEQGMSRHPDGFGSPVGKMRGLPKFNVGKELRLTFTSGIEVRGVVEKVYKRKGKIILVTFGKCTVTHGTDILFNPSWGKYDMAVGDKIISVYGGPSDRKNFKTSDDFKVRIIPRRKLSEKESILYSMYSRVREIREKKLVGGNFALELNKITQTLEENYSSDWLLLLEILELSIINSWDNLQAKTYPLIIQKIKDFPKYKSQIEDGLTLLN